MIFQFIHGRNCSGISGNSLNKTICAHASICNVASERESRLPNCLSICQSFLNILTVLPARPFLGPYRPGPMGARQGPEKAKLLHCTLRPTAQARSPRQARWD